LGTKGGTGRNEQATCVVESYLRAANISHTPLPDGGISVMTPAGDEVHVVFASEGSQTAPPPPSKYPTISVNPETVLTTKKDMTMSVFHEITEKAGHGRPVPVERGPEPIGVVNDFFLVSIRHRDFRTVPNPPDEELRAHEKLITDICTKFHSRFQWLCSKKGYGVGDLKTFALAWATIFLGKYRRTRRSRVENEKLLRAHIEKRLWGEFAPRLQRDLRIDHIDTETYQVATTGDVEGVREEAEERVAGRPIELDLSDDDARRKSARSMLVSKLSALPHQSLISMLTEAAQNAALCPETRSEARRRLTLHRKKCADCSASDAPALVVPTVIEEPSPQPELASASVLDGVEMDEDVPGTDAGGDEE
jgi:hypothetical protein